MEDPANKPQDLKDLTGSDALKPKTIPLDEVTRMVDGALNQFGREMSGVPVTSFAVDGLKTRILGPLYRSADAPVAK